MDSHPTSFEPEFTLYDGLRIRYVRSPRPAAESVLMLSPWPESVYAFVRMWPRLSERFSLAAVDLPGFGQSDGRADLMSPRRMGDFVVQITDERVNITEKLSLILPEQHRVLRPAGLRSR